MLPVREITSVDRDVVIETVICVQLMMKDENEAAKSKLYCETEKPRPFLSNDPTMVAWQPDGGWHKNARTMRSLAPLWMWHLGYQAGFVKASASAPGFCFPRLLSHYYWRGLVHFKTADPLTAEFLRNCLAGGGSEWFTHIWPVWDTMWVSRLAAQLVKHQVRTSWCYK